MLILEQIPMRQDNYSYAVIKDNFVIMIDPSEETESIAYFNARPELKLAAIINTHSHIDHVGGNDVLWQKWKCPVFGPKVESVRVPHCSNELLGGEKIELLGLTISTYDVHAHTIGHLAFKVEHPFTKVIKQGAKRKCFEAHHLSNRPVMFVGDSLFAAGCGRLFEGSPEDLARSLSFYAQENPETLMACAHEYTKANLKFAQAIFPQNSFIEKRLQAIDTLLNEEGSSVPCLFKEEFLTNPFLLAVTTEKEFIAQKYGVDKNDLPAIASALRRAKDMF